LGLLWYLPWVPKYDLVTIGESFEDLIFLNLPRLPGLGEEIKTNEFVRTFGGGALITAVAGARLGLDCLVVSGLSREAGKRIRSEGVTVRNVRRSGEPHAISAALSTGAERTFVTYNGVNEILEERLAGPAGRADGRHLHFAFYPADCRRWSEIVLSVKKRGRTTSWDFGWNEGLVQDPGLRSLLTALDFVFVNEAEALLYSKTANLVEAEKFWQKNSSRAVVKCGAQGSRLVTRDGVISAPPFPVNALDPTGAGDAFNAGFLCALLRGQAVNRCLIEGNRVGALSTLRAGGLEGLPVRDELL
jgi:sugar/nucleoside kinase (ribokinase family)